MQCEDCRTTPLSCPGADSKWGNWGLGEEGCDGCRGHSLARGKTEAQRCSGDLGVGPGPAEASGSPPGLSRPLLHLFIAGAVWGAGQQGGCQADSTWLGQLCTTCFRTDPGHAEGVERGW